MMADKDKEKVPEQLQDYLKLDLGRDQPLAGELFNELEFEAEASEIELTDVIGAMPAHITPRMRTWYGANIAPVRTAALNAIKAAFEGTANLGGGNGILIEAEVARIEEEERKDRRRYHMDTVENDRARYEECKRLSMEYQDREGKLRAKRDKYGRDPKMTGWFYYVILSLIIIPEFLINYETFNSLSFATPLIASGLTIIVALGVALAAHFQGTVVKQWRYYFGKEQRHERRGEGRRKQIIGATCLFISLLAIFYGRTVYFSSLTIDLGFGQQETANPVWVIGGSLIGNILVFLLGLGFAWYHHDEDPEYPDAQVSRDNFKGQYDRLRAKLDAERREEMERISAETHQKMAQYQRVDEAQRNNEGYKAFRAHYASFSAQDKKVAALMEKYRGELVRKMRENEAFAVAISVESSEEKERLAPDQFLAKPIILKLI